MKNLLAFLGAAVLVFAGVGLYLNWFHIARGPAVAGHKAFNIDLNTDKIESDAQKGGEKVLERDREGPPRGRGPQGGGGQERRRHGRQGRGQKSRRDQKR